MIWKHRLHVMNIYLCLLSYFLSPGGVDSKNLQYNHSTSTQHFHIKSWTEFGYCSSVKNRLELLCALYTCGCALLCLCAAAIRLSWCIDELFVLSSLEVFCLPIAWACPLRPDQASGQMEDSRQPPAAESRCVCLCVVALGSRETPGPGCCRHLLTGQINSTGRKHVHKHDKY